jgi:hypothetical protein
VPSTAADQPTIKERLHIQLLCPCGSRPRRLSGEMLRRLKGDLSRFLYDNIPHGALPSSDDLIANELCL